MLDQHPPVAQGETLRTRDIFEGKHSQPLIGLSGGEARYLGRVVIELWERPGYSDAQMLALAAHPLAGDSTGFVKRVAEALPIRLSRSPGMLRM